MKYILIIAMIFLVLSLKAQVFAPIGANWYYSDQNSGASPSNSEYIHFQSSKDTIIKGHSVRKIIRKHHHYRGDTSILKPLYVYNSTDTVFIFNPDNDKFNKLYIFNKSKGDTISLDVPYGDYNSPTLNRTIYRLVIDSVATEKYNGMFVKKYKTRGLDNFQFWNSGWYMDYIGGLDWFFPRAAMILEAGGPLRCYSDNNFSVNFTSKPCDYLLINSLSDISDNCISIFPNPASDIIQFSSSKQIDKYEIFDNLGVLQIIDCKTKKDISQLTSGIYIVRIVFEDKTVMYRKVIKNNAIVR